MAVSILSRAETSQIVAEPYPHIVIDEALPPDYFAELEASYPSLELVANGKTIENNSLYLMSARAVCDNADMPEVWRDFFAYHASPVFFEEVKRFWADWIPRAHPDLAENFGKPLEDFTIGLRHPGQTKNPDNREADLMMDCQFGVNSPVTQVSSVREPHLDNPAKLFAALLYFRHTDDHADGGDLEFYRLKGRFPKHRGRNTIDAKYIEKVKTVEYKANRLVTWLNSPYSIHGVSPRSVTQLTRRYINFLGECYAGKRELYFTRTPQQPSLLKNVLNRLVPGASA